MHSLRILNLELHEEISPQTCKTIHGKTAMNFANPRRSYLMSGPGSILPAPGRIPYTRIVDKLFSKSITLATNLENLIGNATVVEPANAGSDPSPNIVPITGPAARKL